MFLGERKLTMLSVSGMVDVLDFDFDMEEKVETQPTNMFSLFSLSTFLLQSDQN